MIPVGIAKFALDLAIGMGVSKITSDIVKNNVVINNTVQKVTVAVGTFVVGSMASDAASKHVKSKAKSIAKSWRDHKESKNPTDNVEEIVQAA